MDEIPFNTNSSTNATSPLRVPMRPSIGTPTRVAHAMAWPALLAAATLTVLLGVRELGSPDIGYHLAYGEAFWNTGRLVDHNPFIFTLPPHDSIAPADTGDLAPGCWYDSEGRYRFPNANWGTQVILAAVNTHLGEAALMWMLPLMTGTIVVLMLLSMRRLNLSPLAMAVGLMLFALVAYERFILRPEMFSYVLLAAQFFVLVGWRGRVRQIVVLAVLQLLLVNVHSYFLLGLALTGAFTVDALLRRGREKRGAGILPASGGGGGLTFSGALANGTHNAGGTPASRPLLVTLAIQLVVCFVNPWTWRLAVMPFQTLLFMREHKISGQYGPTEHPWSIIGEFFSPFHAFANYWATATYVVLLVLTVVATIVPVRRLWRGAGVSPASGDGGGLTYFSAQAHGTHNAGGTPAPHGTPAPLAWLLVIVGMAVVSLSMRRNIAPFAMLAAPLILAVLAKQWDADDDPATRLKGRAAWLRPVPALLVLALAVGLAVHIPNNKLYVAEQSPARFGLAYAPMEIPLAPCEFITKTLQPAAGQRIWCDYNISSNVHYYTLPHPDVPLVTNTWAYPPSTMRMVLDASWATAGVIEKPVQFADLYEKFGFQIVLLRVEGMTWALAYSLARHDDWALVYADARHVAFVRRDGLYAPRLAELELTSARMARHTPPLLDKARTQDPTGATLYYASVTLSTLGYDQAAIDAMRQLVEFRRTSEHYNRLGQLLAMRANRLGVPKAGKYYDAKKLLQEAADAFETAVKLDKSNTTAKNNLGKAREDLQTLESGKPLPPRPETM